MRVEEMGVLYFHLRKFIFPHKMFIPTLNRDWKEPSLPLLSSLSRIGGREEKAPNPATGFPPLRRRWGTLPHCAGHSLGGPSH